MEKIRSLRILRKTRYCLAVFIFICLFPFNLNSQYYPKHEMRAVWIATVNNIDWPSKPGLSVEEQKLEMKSLLDIFLDYNMNTVVFQIRPAADAFYPSALEPWSQWLSGEQGKAPEPYYDPLEFVIGECRERGLDIHVWLNPYRAVTDTANITSPDHISRKHPEWFVTYGKTVYFDPGLSETRDYVASVAGDIVRRYDIDAIHMDDYFYPYRIANQSFPDDSSFVKYPRGFAPEQKEEWRRENVNLIIKQLQDTIKAIKPWVEFGISPFGVWRNIDRDPAGSKTRAGVTNYDDLYADILLWQKNGWIDYIVPQIYWHIGYQVADYAALADWWSHNAFGTRLYVGHAPYRITSKASAKEWRTSKEINRQVTLNRTYPNIGGSVYFSAKVFRSNPLRFKERITRKIYRYPSLTVPNNRIKPVIPVQPSGAFIAIDNGILNLSWIKGADTKNFVVYRLRKGKPADMADPGNIFMITPECRISVPVSRLTDPSRYFYVVSARSLSNNESDPVYFRQAAE